jgi:hypothetical protein
MDPTVIQAIEKATREAAWLNLWPYVLVGLFTVIAAFWGAYAKRKGENLATKEDLAHVLEQTRATTRISEAIRSEVSRSHTVSTADLEYRKQQLAEFYGPIYAYLKLSAELYRLWIDGKLQEINDDILRLFREQNDKIEAIITTKAHLIEGGEIAVVFTRFMTSASIFNFYTARPGQNFVPEHVAKLPESKWPQEFQRYIYDTTEQLKHELDRLYRSHRIASSGTEIA